ncbi:hypothetical protein quinque_014300 [Culex quinquefasciatus]
MNLDFGENHLVVVGPLEKEAAGTDSDNRVTKRAEEHRKDGSGGEKDDDDDGAKYGTSPDQSVTAILFPHLITGPRSFSYKSRNPRLGSPGTTRGSPVVSPTRPPCTIGVDQRPAAQG